VSNNTVKLVASLSVAVVCAAVVAVIEHALFIFNPTSNHLSAI